MLARLLRSNLLLRFLAEGGSRGTAFLLIPLVSWNLGADAFGHYSQIIAFAFAFVPLISAGLGFTVIRRLAGGQPNRYSLSVLRRALGLVSALTLVQALALFVVSEPVFTLLAIESFPLLPLLVAALSWSAAIEAMLQEFFRALGLVRRSVLFQFGGAMLLLSLLGLLWLTGQFSLVSVLSAMVLARTAIVALGLVMALRESGVTADDGRQKAAISLLAGLPFMLAGLAEWGGNLGDRLIAGRFLDVTAVGEYAAAMMMLSLIIALGAPIWWLLFPATAAALNNDQRPEAATRRYTMIFIELALPVLILLVLIADPLLSLLLNQPVTGMQPVMLLAGLAVFINQLTTGHEYYLVSVSGGKRLMGATLVWVSAGFALSLLLAPIWGLAGIAAGALAGKLGLAITFTVMARRNGFMGMPWSYQGLGNILAMSGLAGIVAYMLVDDWYLQAVIFVLAAGSIRVLTLAGSMARQR